VLDAAGVRRPGAALSGGVRARRSIRQIPPWRGRRSGAGGLRRGGSSASLPQLQRRRRWPAVPKAQGGDGPRIWTELQLKVFRFPVAAALRLASDCWHPVLDLLGALWVQW